MQYPTVLPLNNNLLNEFRFRHIEKHFFMKRQFLGILFFFTGRQISFLTYENNFMGLK